MIALLLQKGDYNMKKLFALVLCLCIVLSAFIIKNQKGETVSLNVSEAVTVPVTDTSTEAEQEISPPKIYGVWLTYYEIGALVKGKSEAEYKKSLELVLGKLSKNKINTVFYQCRAFCDSFYKSEIFPTSSYIDDGASLTFDPLKVFIDFAGQYNIAVHGWVNPYRVSYNNQIKNLPKGSPALELYNKSRSSLFVCESGIYLNPACPEANALVLNGIKELLNNYSLAGVHFDDYFYPEADSLADEKAYSQYARAGGTLNLAQWRRENVNALVKSVYCLVKGKDQALIFSISPSADINKCLNTYYCDVAKWCSEEGFADYIIPQLYYGFENENMPFESVLEQWSQLCNGGTRLLCGIAAYKCGRVDSFAGSGKNEWCKNVNILSRQYEQTVKSKVYQGFVLFSYSYVFGENVTQISKKEIKNLLYMVE